MDIKRFSSKPKMLVTCGITEQVHELDTKGLSEIEFGHHIKEQEFLLKSDTSFFNHGSYGTVPRRVLDMQHAYNLEREVHTDLWFRVNSRRYVDLSRQAVADFIGANVQNVLLVGCATTALNNVVKSYPFKAGDILLDTTLTYGSIGNLCGDLATRIHPDVKRIKMEIGFPILSEDDVINKYEMVFKENPNIKMAIIDHITSPTSMVMPVKRLIEICHRHGALAVIDGAHAIGQIPIDLKELKADFYTTNLHKWAYSPRGAAVLWFADEHATWLNPSNSSWNIGQALDDQFFDQGTRDHVPYICARHGLQFYQAIGGMDRIVKYTSKLADQAKMMINTELGLESLAIPVSMEAPNMKLFKLPAHPDFKCSGENLWRLHQAIFESTKVFGLLMIIDGDFYFRLSTQVYTDMDDVKALINALKAFIEKQQV